MAKNKLLYCLQYELNPNANTKDTYDLIKGYPLKKVDLNYFKFLCLFEHDELLSNEKFTTDRYVGLSRCEGNPLFINKGFESNVRGVRTKNGKMYLIIKILDKILDVEVFRLGSKYYQTFLQQYRSGKYVEQVYDFKSKLKTYRKVELKDNKNYFSGEIL